MDRDHLSTERAHPRSEALGSASVEEAFELFQAVDGEILSAIEQAKPAIVEAIELVVDRLGRGGRLIYVGAGTSGRLGVLDASECPPTFHSDPRAVQGVIAGGDLALRSAIEGAEDSRSQGRHAIVARRVGPNDVVFGITAGGTTPFVHAALEAARERDAATIFFACVSASSVPDDADVSIRVVTGPEALAGSTRLKAGTATKLVLNRITTIAMARLGKVHGNLMVDVDARANAKLWQRATGILMQLTGLDREVADQLLGRAEGRVKRAAVMHAHGLDSEGADRKLESVDGFLDRALA